jgi:two-component system LytT family sensor kinase
LLQANIRNTKEAELSEHNEGKIGLDNIKRQLELLYPLHTLKLMIDQNYYNVELTIPLNDSL